MAVPASATSTPESGGPASSSSPWLDFGRASKRKWAQNSAASDAACPLISNVPEMYGQMARIAITPDWVRYYDFGAGRMPRFLQDLAERHQT